MKFKLEFKNFKVEMNKVVSWIMTILQMLGGAVLTTYLVQYLLLDADLFEKLSDRKWRLNIACVLIVYLVTLLISKRTVVSVVVSHGLITILAFVNYYVYLFRENEFIFADLRTIMTGLSVAGSYHIELTARGIHVILATVLFFLFAILFRVKFEKGLIIRTLSGAGAIVLCAFLVANTSSINTETWEQKGTYLNGYVLNFVLSARDSFVSEPEGYSLDVIADLEEEYGTAEMMSEDAVEEVQPTIIVIMSESFADLSVIGEFETNEPLTPFMDSLEEDTIKGYALSSVFGAKTPNSEWEFLTGGSMAFLPTGSVVYQQYITDTPTSLVSTLKNEGYTCVSMHPYYETGWSRNQIYPKLGFDESYFIEDFDQTQLIREYISDRELYSKIIERYESSSAEENLFIMSVSMQNHGGYATSYDNFEENYYKIGRSYTDANQYFSLIRESDDALKSFINYFQLVDEPVEIVFFGDHQPSLNSKFYEILNGKGLSGLTLGQLEDLYTVPFFIWTNYDTPEETVEITSLNYLSTLALERAGIELPAYNQFLADMMDVVPAINSRGYYSLSKGKFVHLEDALGEELSWISKYESLQYNSLFDSKNESCVFFPYIEE